MQFRFVQSLLEPVDSISKISAACFSPNGARLAVASADRVISIFDEVGERRDKFSTKPADKGPKNYIVRDMAFSPDCTRLAVAQSDNIVFVYKLGLDWNDKKSICNKFPQTSPVTCLTWPISQNDDIYFGLAEGKVKQGLLRTNKSTVFCNKSSYVTSITTAYDGSGIASAHLDGSIMVYLFDSPSAGCRLLCRSINSNIFTISWGRSIAAAGNDSKVYFYETTDLSSPRLPDAIFDYSDDTACSDFVSSTSSPTGEVIVLGNYSRFYTYSFDSIGHRWIDAGYKHVNDLHTVTALAWRSDGNRLIVGSLCGAVDAYEVCLRRQRYQNKFEFTYISPSQVVIKKLSDRKTNTITSKLGLEIGKINIYQDQYLVAKTARSLIIGDVSSGKICEYSWDGDGISEKFLFDNPSACVIYYAGEVTVIEYGAIDVLGSIRTDFVSCHIMSIRISETGSTTITTANDVKKRRVVGQIVKRSTDDDDDDSTTRGSKRIAYLLDSQTINIHDLVQKSSCNIPHDSKIDWLELNSNADMLLYRDKRQCLYCYHINDQQRYTMIGSGCCSYAQWVPDSDVVVGQARNELHVWYNVKSCPSQSTMHTIKGDVEEIERCVNAAGAMVTEVVVNEGSCLASYVLDETLIEFGSATDAGDYQRAVDILEKLEMTGETEVMWQKLESMAIDGGNVMVACQCAAAMGNIARVRFLQGSLKLADESIDKILGSESYPTSQDGLYQCRSVISSLSNHYQVRCDMALIRGNLDEAETVLMSQGRTDECIDMYRQLDRQRDCIRVADVSHHPQAAQMRLTYYNNLISSGRDCEAAEVKQEEGDYFQAIQLFLKANLPGRAASIAIQHHIEQPANLLESIASSLVRMSQFDKAGEFYEMLGQLNKSMENYVKGTAYHKAVELARRCYPSQVVSLQEAWGDYLSANKNLEGSISHFIDAQNYPKAIEACISCRQFNRALTLSEACDARTAKPYFKRLAVMFADIKLFDLAEKCYLACDNGAGAVEMYTRAGNWDNAHKIAVLCMNSSDVALLYINEGKRLEEEGRLKDAEKLYLTVKEIDLAITMYRKHRRFDDLIRLVEENKRSLLKESHQFVAQTMEMEGNLKQAEHHYVEANEWLSSVNMYRSNELWDDAIRVAKTFGGLSACKRITVALAMSLGSAEGARLLAKHGLVEAAIDHLLENNSFDKAFELAKSSLPKKLIDVYMKRGQVCEDDGKLKEAEDAYILANKPREAIDMYVNEQDWISAIRICEAHDVTALPDVFSAQGKTMMESGNLLRAEELFVMASKPEFALDMYKKAENWVEAMRVARYHLPQKLDEIRRYAQASEAKLGRGGSKSDFMSAARSWEAQSQWSQAIDAYMNATIVALSNPNDLEEIWQRAVSVCKQHVPSRLSKVTSEVMNRLIEIDRPESAADLLTDVGRLDEAVQVCISARRFDKARSLAQGNNALLQSVHEAQESHFVQMENSDALLATGHMNAALDVMAQRKEWTRLWEALNKQNASPVLVAKYTLDRVSHILSNEEEYGDEINEAVQLLSKKGLSLSQAALPVCRKLVQRVLGRDINEESKYDQLNVVIDLRSVMVKLIAQTHVRNADGSVNDVMKIVMSVHFYAVYLMCKQHGLVLLAAKVSLSLLRFASSTIPCDKCFYLAGLACKDAGNNNLAFILWNRFIGIAEMMEEHDVSLIDVSDLDGATLLPKAALTCNPAPSRFYVTDIRAREECREWVLTACTDTSIDQVIPASLACVGTLFEGLVAPIGLSIDDINYCSTSGFPLAQAGDRFDVNGTSVNKRDWNAFVMKTKICPWTWQAQKPIH